jgi:NAD(P)-dependent dehydrogenase (short-subunit alcohol dehydrogenase family)
VILTARDKLKGEKALTELPGKPSNVKFIQMDTADESSIDHAARQVENEYPRLDVLINNAAILHDKSNTLNVPKRVLQEHLETNFFGPLLTSRYFLPLLKKSSEGRIINFSTSMASLHAAGGGYAAYRLSKIALNGLTAVMAADLAGSGISVNCLDPGWVRTDMGGAGANRSVRQGADTAIWLATASRVPTGKFFRDRKEITW